MLRFWLIGTLVFHFLIGVKVQALLDVEVKSDSALLINSQTGKVIFEKNASKLMYPASCTKIAFAFYAIKYHQSLFNKILIGSQNALKSMPESQKSRNNFADIPSYVLETDASHMGLKVGEEMRFYDLLEGSMVVSADDASNMLAEAMGDGSIEKCVNDVNAFVASMGCKNTHFTNPHGLHHPNHVTTAHDLALICREAMKEPIFAKMAKMTRFKRPKTNKQDSVMLRQTNRLLMSTNPLYYSPAVGIKTGYHRRAGYCLASQAEHNNRKLISIIFHGKTGKERFQDSINLFESAFRENLATQEFLAAGLQPFEKHVAEGTSPLMTITKESLSYNYYPSEKPKVNSRVVWFKVEPPIKKDMYVGDLLLLVDGEVYQKTKLFAANNVELTLMSSIRQNQKVIILIILGVIAAIVVIIIVKRRHLAGKN